MNTAAHAGTHTQNVYGSRDDSVCATFVECEKSEILNTHTQKKNKPKTCPDTTQTTQPPTTPQLRCLVDIFRSFDYTHSVVVEPEGVHQTAELGVVGGIVVWVLFPPSAFNFKRAWRGQLSRRMHHTF